MVNGEPCLDISVVPDFIAIGGLVTVFASLLKRTRQTRLSYWLVGWVMILGHIFAQLVQRNLLPGAGADAALASSLSSLLLASVAFVWAGNDMHLGRSRGLSLTLLCAAPDVAFFCCAAYAVESPAAYLVFTLLGLFSTLTLLRGGRRHADKARSRWRLLAVVFVYAVQGALVLRGLIDAALVWMLFTHYLAVAFFFHQGAPRSTVGVSFTTVSFIAWASVFPLAYALSPWLADMRIEDEAWNLPKFLVATGMIFTLLEEQMGLAEHASMHDALTGLPNRRVFTQRLQVALAHAREAGGRVAVMVIDLDDFKRVNDTLGHAAGDALLRFVAERWQAVLRLEDTLARLGGDEFAAILPSVPDRPTAEQLAVKLAQAVQPGIEFQGDRLSVGASIGVALYPDDAEEESRLYAAADRAMYRTKMVDRGEGQPQRRD